MSARDDLVYRITRHCSAETAEQMLDAYRAEILAETEAKLYDGLVSFNAVACWPVLQLAQMRQYLAEHLASVLHAAGEKATPTEAKATPDFFQPGHTYTEPGDTTDWRFRCDSITTHPENGERTALGWRHFRGEWEPYAYDEDDFEIHLIAGLADDTEAGEAP